MQQHLTAVVTVYRLGVDEEAVKTEALRRLKREQEGEGAPIKKKTVVRPLSLRIHSSILQDFLHRKP